MLGAVLSLEVGARREGARTARLGGLHKVCTLLGSCFAVRITHVARRRASPTQNGLQMRARAAFSTGITKRNDTSHLTLGDLGEVPLRRQGGHAKPSLRVGLRSSGLQPRPPLCVIDHRSLDGANDLPGMPCGGQTAGAVPARLRPDGRHFQDQDGQWAQGAQVSPGVRVRGRTARSKDHGKELVRAEG